ncbi:putative ABC transporter permease YknZ [Lacunisphaera limnophila]|uniref:Putative ABC transporter permease YknZ n=1 Tax=Lacunisphaera limnophila TaxID=1838286 RepID=A0A1D8AZ95_9BACT|nr:ABC transporter permease [Lacunisphaera limnophila]AOS46191.1 putative ABC transporter permease YknZ [Lacunisphaera limnophila]
MPPEFKSAVRHLWRQPGFTLLAVLSLGTAIGVNSAMFSIVNGFLLRETTTHEPENYVAVFHATRDARRDYRPFSHAEFAALRADQAVFADVSAAAYSQVALGDPGEIRRAFAFLVSDNFFALAAARPALGRFFTAAETSPGAGQAVVVASHALWQRLGGRADFVGSALRINGRFCTVIGIAPPGFSGASPLLAPEVWLPLGFFSASAPAFAETRRSPDLSDPRNHVLNLFARLDPGLTRATAATRLPAVAGRLARLDPDPGTEREIVLARPFGIAPQPVRDNAFASLTTLTLGLSAVVLIIACLNLSNLLLARGVGRAPEIATRLALGASRGRILGQLLLEGLLLAVTGGALGVLISSWAGSFLAQVLADRVADFGFQVTTSFQADLPVLGFTLLVSLVASLAFSLGPALVLSRRDLTNDLKGAARGTLAGEGRTLWGGRNILLMLQMGFSLVSLFAAGLFLRAAFAALEPPTGFDPRGRLVAEIDFALSADDPLTVRRRATAALAAARRQPGVAQASLASLVPYANDVQLARVSLPGSAPETGRSTGIPAAFSAISDGYFSALGVRLLLGRDFTPQESLAAGAAPVCVVDETLARRLFPTGNWVGQILTLQGGPAQQVQGEHTIVGVVSAHSQDVVDRSRPLPRVFVPFARIDHPVWFLVAYAPDDNSASLLHRTLLASDATLPLVMVTPLESFLAANFGRWQAGLAASLFGLFGLIAVVLAAIGIYGVTAYNLSRRARELGLRTALGAGTGDIIRLVVGRGFVLLGLSVAAGSIACGLVGLALAGFVPDVAAFDPLVFAACLLTLFLSATPALLLPACRAAKVDPLVALRAE